jgi:hypothetical protein
MSAAILLPAGRRFHSSASASPENAIPIAAAVQVAMLRADLLDFIVPSSPEDLPELGFWRA